MDAGWPYIGRLTAIGCKDLVLKWKPDDWPISEVLIFKIRVWFRHQENFQLCQTKPFPFKHYWKIAAWCIGSMLPCSSMLVVLLFKCFLDLDILNFVSMLDCGYMFVLYMFICQDVCLLSLLSVCPFVFVCFLVCLVWIHLYIIFI